MTLFRFARPSELPTTHVGAPAGISPMLQLLCNVVSTIGLQALQTL